MSRRHLAIGTLLLVGVGVLAVATLRTVAPVAPVAPRSDAPRGVDADAVPRPEATAAAVAPTASEAPPPWATGLPADGIAGDDAGTASPRERHVAALQETMSLMVEDALQRSEANSVHMRKALEVLEAIDDPAVKAQIDLAGLRHNMEVSLQMQALAREMQAALATPKTPQRDAAIDALQVRFDALRRQLRTDVAPPGPGAPATAGQGR